MADTTTFSATLPVLKKNGVNINADASSTDKIFIAEFVRSIKEDPSDSGQTLVDYKDLNGEVYTFTIDLASDAVQALFDTDISGTITLSGGIAASTVNSGISLQRDTDDEGVGARRTLHCEYDFATDGGAIGVHTLSVSLPDNAIPTYGWYEVGTTFTSATDAATVALGYATDGAAALKAAIAISNGANPWDAGYGALIQTGVPSTFGTKTTASRALILTIAVEAVTAGKLMIHLDYVVGY